MTHMVNVKVGDVAPDFTLPDQDGKPVTFSKLRGKNVVLYFYPKDFSSGCTREACGFRDSYEDFTDAGAIVVGVSGDSVESHKKFIEEYKLPFTLLSDMKGEVRQLYGTYRIMGLLSGRYTFVIDKEGVIKDIFSSETNMQKHIDEALSGLKNLG
jgi:peroxiredoxin Q/BCP